MPAPGTQDADRDGTEALAALFLRVLAVSYQREPWRFIGAEASVWMCSPAQRASLLLAWQRDTAHGGRAEPGSEAPQGHRGDRPLSRLHRFVAAALRDKVPPKRVARYLGAHRAGDPDFDALFACPLD
jgi:hypothetical protein